MEAILVILLIASSIFSGSEVAIFSMNRLRLKKLKVNNPSLHQIITKLKANPQALLAGILLGNELVNTSFVLAGHIVISNYYIGEDQEVLKEILNIFMSVVLLLICGEITPKILGASSPQGFLKFSHIPLRIFLFVTFPLRVVLNLIVKLIVKMPNTQDRFDEIDLKDILESGKSTGEISAAQSELIESTLILDDLVANTAMTKKENIIWIGSEKTVGDALELFRNARFSRLPIYDEKNLEPIGFIRMRDFLQFVEKKERFSQSIKPFIQKPLVVSSRNTLNKIFFMFKSMHVHMAFIYSPSREFLGLITMDDIIRKMKQYRESKE